MQFNRTIKKCERNGADGSFVDGRIFLNKLKKKMEITEIWKLHNSSWYRLSNQRQNRTIRPLELVGTIRICSKNLILLVVWRSSQLVYVPDQILCYRHNT